MDKKEITNRIKEKAIDLGFSAIGIAKAEFMDEEASRLETWLNKNYHGEMSYMENHFDKRLDPTKLVPGARSVISLMYNYYPSSIQNEDSYKIAKYAYGKDYHKVVKKKLLDLFNWCKEHFGNIEGRCFVDSAPVLERDWAKRAGIGWIGKNTLLLNKNLGSFYFLGEIIFDLELEYDHKVKDHCGTCTRCIDACPTDAISKEGYLMDGSKCISYLTIELKNSIPEEFKNQMNDWVFGCDICQDVCPWNRFSKPHHEEKFLPTNSLLSMTKNDWEEISEPIFQELFQGSAVKRTKFEGLKRNISFVSED